MSVELSPSARQLHQAHIERRLRIAAKAVRDRPINLKFKNGVEPTNTIPIKSVDSEQENQNSLEIKELKEKLLGIEIKLSEVIHTLPTHRPQNLSDYRYPTITEIIQIVCKYYSVKKREICSHSRNKKFGHARTIGYYQCRMHTVRSYPEIGRMFGGKDHTCPLRSFRKISFQRLLDPKLDLELTEISELITELVSTTN